MDLDFVARGGEPRASGCERGGLRTRPSCVPWKLTPASPDWRRRPRLLMVPAAPELSCSVSLEVLHGALVFLSLFARVERTEVFSFVRFRIYFARVEPVLA